MVNKVVNKRVALFFWDGGIAVSPSITNTLLLLHKDGFEVDCITRYVDDTLADEINFPNGINIYRFGNEHKGEKVEVIMSATSKKINNNFAIKIKNFFGVYNIKKNIKININLLSTFCGYLKFGNKVTSKQHYSHIIGVDTNGLAASGIVFFKRRRQIIYFSLEIRFVSDFKYIINRIIKRAEKYFHRKSQVTIIQDTYRYEALCIENEICDKSKNYIIVPNGPIGKYEKIKNDYFANKFNLSSSNVILLHAGGLSSGYMNDEIALSCSSLSERFKLIFHFFSFRKEDSHEVGRLKSLSKNKALFSTNPVSLDKLAEITSSAHIGIAFYNKDRGLNHSLILGASGKMANYLQCGIPVIVLNLPGFKELFEEYHCGIVIDTPIITDDVINAILDDYEKYSSGAIRCFNEVYEFENHFNHVLDKMNPFRNSPIN